MKDIDTPRDPLTHRIIGCALRVHRTLGGGFLESVYQEALTVELGSAGMRFERHRPITVWYGKVAVGRFVADLVVEDRVLVENKAVQALQSVHEVQIVNYLTATRIDIGLLFNFGPERLEFHRKFRVYQPRGTASPTSPGAPQPEPADRTNTIDTKEGEKEASGGQDGHE